MKLRDNEETPAISVGRLITLLRQLPSNQIIYVGNDVNLMILSQDQKDIHGKILIASETKEDWSPPRARREL